MNRAIASHRANPHHRAPSKSSTTHCLIEPLENRQLLSLTIDIQLADGATTAMVSAGQTLHLQVWAVVSGTVSPATDDDFQEVWGSFIGTKTATGSVAGNLSAHLISPFNAIASQAGKSQDLNGDGSLDVGSTAPDTASSDDYFFPRAGSMESGGKVIGNTESYEIATLAYTVTSIGTGQATDINFVPRISPAVAVAVWRQDGTPMHAAPDETPLIITGTGVNPPSPSISGHVYSSGTTPLAGATVYLGNTATETTTDSSGSYSFTGLAAGNYVVYQVPPTGYTQTAPTANAGDSVTLLANQVVTTANFTDAPITTPLGSISGYVFNDIKGGGVYKTGDAPIPNWVVTLYPLTNGQPAAIGTATQTDSNGNFTFTNVPAGHYEVLETLTFYWRISGTAPNYIDVTLAPGATVKKLAFAATTRVLLSGTVFNDVNGDGVQDENRETGLGGWEISVYTSATATTSIANAITAPNGSFAIYSLSAGSYFVRIKQLSGYQLTTPQGGNIQIGLNPGYIDDTGLNFGEQKI